MAIARLYAFYRRGGMSRLNALRRALESIRRDRQFNRRVL